MENGKHVGEIYETKSWGNLVITKYINNREVHVKFISTGYVTQTAMKSIIKGSVRDRLLPSVHGVGIAGAESIVDEKGEKLKEYSLWCSMLQRCYDEKKHKELPSYTDCTVSENFKYFPYFKDWCNKQIGFNVEGFALDKDILVKGNKVYSEDTCCFVPYEINGIFPKCDRSRGEYLLGVYYNKRRGMFTSSLCVSGKQLHLGGFETELDAFLAYKTAKEARIRNKTLAYKESICPRVYDALMNYSVDIND